MMNRIFISGVILALVFGVALLQTMRTGLGVGYDRIGLIAPDMALVVHGEENGWYIINFDDEQGYVSGEYVTLHETG